VKNNGNVRRD